MATLDLSTPEASSTEQALARLSRAGERGVLRFLTCGSVDDGKSTLIGRLLFDTKLIFEDQLTTLEKDSKKHGTAGEEIDYALLLDGLEAEREQGITIDVAYRFFATDKRKFIVADTPGHEQYTRNMATGASTADLAIILVDSRKGVLPQTKRHTYIVHLLGIRHVVLAINKMDLVEHSRARFHEVVAEYMTFADELGFETITPVPLSARYGENLTTRCDKMKWYDGPTLLEHLEGIDIETRANEGPFRFPVQWVNRPNLDFRGFSGAIVSGAIAVGDPVVVAQSGAASKIARIVTADGDLDRAEAGDAVTLVLADEIDISRGDLIASPDARPEVANQFAANILWMSDDELKPGRPYVLKIGGAQTSASIVELKHRIDINTMEKRPAKTLGLNEIGFCNIDAARPVAFDAYKDVHDTGAFILVDRFTNQTVGAGMIAFGLRRASNVYHHHMDVNKTRRAAMKGQKPCLLWFTGLSGAGKSTIANLVEQKLADEGFHTYSLDGDNIRHGLNRDLGFTDVDRVENIRRIGEVGKLFVDAGTIVMCSFISPFRAERQLVRDLVGENEFMEVFVDAPLEVCIERDPKGLYKKAQAGEIKNFTGFDSPYEPPEAPEIVVKTESVSPSQCAEDVIRVLRERGVLTHS